MLGAVKIACSVEARTEQALLIKHGERYMWIPLSQIEQEIQEPTGPMHIMATTFIIVPIWLAKEKGLKATQEDTKTLDLF